MNRVSIDREHGGLDGAAGRNERDEERQDQADWDGTQSDAHARGETAPGEEQEQQRVKEQEDNRDGLRDVEKAIIYGGIPMGDHNRFPHEGVAQEIEEGAQKGNREAEQAGGECEAAEGNGEQVGEEADRGGDVEIPCDEREGTDP